MLFELDRRKSQTKSGMHMSTNITSVSDLDLVEFDVSAVKSQ